jgi:hypothetical protein
MIELRCLTNHLAFLDLCFRPFSSNARNGFFGRRKWFRPADLGQDLSHKFRMASGTNQTLQGFRRSQPDRENENDVGLVEPGSGAARAIIRQSTAVRLPVRELG